MASLNQSTNVRKDYRLFISNTLVEHLLSVRSSIPENIVIRSVFNCMNHVAPISISYIDMSPNQNDEVSYYLISKIDSEDRIFKSNSYFQSYGTSSRRTRMGGVTSKVGRVFRKILEEIGVAVTDREIEEFVNAYKQNWESRYGDASFEVVKGEEIRSAYLWSNYSDQTQKGYGTLGNSCMSGDEKQRLLEVYTNNPEVCKLVIKRDNLGKISARALIWTLSNGGYYMDRVYYTHDFEDKMFKSWFIKNYGNYRYYSRGENIPEMSINLRNWKYRLYPYMDSFAFLIWKDGILLSNEPKDARSELFPYALLRLTSVNGIPHSYNHRWSEYESRWVLNSNSFFDREKNSYRTKIKFKKLKKFLPFLRGEFED